MLNPIQKYKAEALKLAVCGTPDELAGAAAVDAVKFLRAAIAVKGNASVLLAAGNSQALFLEKFTAAAGIDWSRVTFFHMDEYLGLSPEHPASFNHYLRERVESKLKPRAFHYLKGDALEPISECLRYEVLLATLGVDLCCMGIGENGHLAFNDPRVANFQDEEGVKIVKLDDACRTQQVGEGHFTSLETVPPYALTITIPILLKADKVICIVPDKRKAEAVRAALNGPIDPICPASVLRRQKHATLFLDLESASLVDFSAFKESPTLGPLAPVSSLLLPKV